MIIAAKCAPCEDKLSWVKNAGLEAVELYLSKDYLKSIPGLIERCKKFALRYAVHAPTDGSGLKELRDLIRGIGAEVVIFHNIYWEDEWGDIVKYFQENPVRLCVENTYSSNEAVKFMRRYGIGRCLDLEHAQLECAGVYEDEFINIMQGVFHVHITGYTYGSKLWHTHIHYSPEHNRYLLSLLKKTGYSGFVVSEARPSLQSYAEFKRLREFYEDWEKSCENTQEIFKIYKK